MSSIFVIWVNIRHRWFSVFNPLSSTAKVWSFPKKEKQKALHSGSYVSVNHYAPQSYSISRASGNWNVWAVPVVWNGANKCERLWSRICRSNSFWRRVDDSGCETSNKGRWLRTLGTNKANLKETSSVKVRRGGKQSEKNTIKYLLSSSFLNSSASKLVFSIIIGALLVSGMTLRIFLKSSPKTGRCWHLFLLSSKIVAIADRWNPDFRILSGEALNNTTISTDFNDWRHYIKHTSSSSSLSMGFDRFPVAANDSGCSWAFVTTVVLASPFWALSPVTLITVGFGGSPWALTSLLTLIVAILCTTVLAEITEPPWLPPVLLPDPELNGFPIPNLAVWPSLFKLCRNGPAGCLGSTFDRSIGAWGTATGTIPACWTVGGLLGFVEGINFRTGRTDGVSSEVSSFTLSSTIQTKIEDLTWIPNLLSNLPAIGGRSIMGMRWTPEFVWTCIITGCPRLRDWATK